MPIRIAHARSGETGGKNGAPGDQTGREVMVSDLAGDWVWILRPSTEDERRTIVATANDICSNDRIGYSQDKRLTLWEEWKKKKDVKKITKKCCCDCSSFVAVCCLSAGIQVSPDIWTGNEKEALTGTGHFIALPYKDNIPHAGDVLLRTGHTAVVVSTPQDTENDHSCIMAKTPAYEFNEEYFGRYDVKTEFAYIRDGGSTSFQAIGILPYGVKVYNYGFFSYDDRGVKWYLVESEYYFGIKYIGFMSEKVLIYYGREKTVHE